MKILRVQNNKLVEDPEYILSSEEQELVEAARNALSKSYSPYSKFKVGAVARMANGELVDGANHENAVFPLGLCAERTAIFAAVNLHPEIPISHLAVTTEQANAIFPCGSCRQVISEYENKLGAPIRLLVIGENEVALVDRIEEILPFAFSKSTLD